MTTNQIEYWKLQENIRHNQVAEAETQRHNVEDEAIRTYTAQTNYEVGLRGAEASYLRGLGGYLSGQSSVDNAESKKQEVKLKKIELIGGFIEKGVNLVIHGVSTGANVLKTVLTAVGS